jgi:hypothetical protein
MIPPVQTNVSRSASWPHKSTGSICASTAPPNGRAKRYSQNRVALRQSILFMYPGFRSAPPRAEFFNPPRRVNPKGSEATARRPFRASEPAARTQSKICRLSPLPHFEVFALLFRGGLTGLDSSDQRPSR